MDYRNNNNARACVFFARLPCNREKTCAVRIKPRDVVIQLGRFDARSRDLFGDSRERRLTRDVHHEMIIARGMLRDAIAFAIFGVSI